jgi:hypothetical protein
MSVAPSTERSVRGINGNKHNRAIEQRTLQSIEALFGIQMAPCFFDWFAAAVMNGIRNFCNQAPRRCNDSRISRSRSWWYEGSRRDGTIMSGRLDSELARQG